jgi:hypothetical protein
MPRAHDRHLCHAFSAALLMSALFLPAAQATGPPLPLMTADFEEAALQEWQRWAPDAWSVTTSVAINDDTDDATQRLAGAQTVGRWYSFLGLGVYNDEAVVTGLRFSALDIPQGSVIEEARIEFHASAGDRSPADFTIRAEDTGDATPLQYNEGDLSDRPLTDAATTWQPESWLVGEHYQTSDIAAVVQEVVAREDWAEDNSLLLVVSGTGRRTAFAHDYDSNFPPRLVVRYVSEDWADHDKAPTSPTTWETTISSADGDANGWIDTPDDPPGLGQFFIGTQGAMLQLHFEDVRVPQGVTIQSAELVLWGTSTENAIAFPVTIQGEASDDSKSFESVEFDSSNRPRTSASQTWEIPTWPSRNTELLTPDLSSIISEIIARPNWQPGNDLALFISGTHPTVAKTFGSFESGSPAVLRITYDGVPTEPVADDPPHAACVTPSDMTPSVLAVDSEVRSSAHNFDLEIRGAKPNSAITIEGQFLGCSDDHGLLYLHKLPTSFLQDCEVVIADPTASVVHTMTQCVPWQDTYFPSRIGADLLHEEGQTGRFVRVAVIDSGMRNNSHFHNLIAGRYDAIQDIEGQAVDEHGHGTHVGSVIGSRGKPASLKLNGVAPDSYLVTVKAFDHTGMGTYADVIRGIQWVIDNKDILDIRVLNLSMSAPPQSWYWDDPLNQAVMQAWYAGITVVASAGNTGPEPMTIGVPGNVPYIITVGAMSDNFTPADPSDDVLASFSSVGPTFEGFVKPEVVAPGGHLLGLMDLDATLAISHPEFHYGLAAVPYFEMSGTSQAAAVVSGAAALLIGKDPTLTPDEVKCLLMTTARPAVDGDDLAYSIFQQGAGLINVYDAAYAQPEQPCANIGLDITKDLADTEHYMGGANQGEDENGDPYYYIEGLDGYVWGDGFVWSNGYVWSDGFVWANGFLWSDGFVWANGFAWANSVTWDENTTIGGASAAGVNVWVAPE